MKTINTFQKNRDLSATKKMREILLKLPDFCYDFFLSIDNTTTPLTQLNYARDLKLFFDFLGNNVFKKEVIQININDMNQMTSNNIERFLGFLSNYRKNNIILSNLDVTKARKLSSVRSFMQFLYNRDFIKSNVASKVKTPKIRQKEIIRLETDEVAKLLNITENPILLSKRQQAYNKLTKERDVALLTLLLGTGIRVSECVGLNVSDIDFDANAFKIIRKGGNEVVLYFSDEIANALKNWIEVRQNKPGINPQENALFLSLQNKRISIRAVENLVKKYAKLISPLKSISPHKLRSTYGTNLYRETKDIYIVADVLGHKDVNTTKKHYAAISEDIRREASKKVKLR